MGFSGANADLPAGQRPRKDPAIFVESDVEQIVQIRWVKNRCGAIVGLCDQFAVLVFFGQWRPIRFGNAGIFIDQRDSLSHSANEEPLKNQEIEHVVHYCGG